MNFMLTSIVPHDALEKNPTNIPYHNPSFPLVRYNKMVCEHFYWKQVALAEEMAKLHGSLLVPSACLSWRRKKKFQDSIILIAGKSFYILKEEVLNKFEKEKFKEYLKNLQSY